MISGKQLGGPGGKKQIIMIGAIVVIVLFTLWQLMGTKSGTTTPPPPLAPGMANKAMSSTSAMGQQAPGGAPEVNAMAVAAQQIAQPKSAPLPANNELLRLQQQTQTDYIASINKLQILKIQREIDETKTAIATAEFNRLTTEKKIADLITSKDSSDITPLVESPVIINSGSNAQQPALPIHTTPKQTEYAVMSVYFQGTRWTAVLNVAGKPATVNVGDTLEDGSIVESINRQTVVLKKDDKIRVLTIASSLQ